MIGEVTAARSTGQLTHRERMQIHRAVTRKPDGFITYVMYDTLELQSANE